MAESMNANQMEILLARLNAALSAHRRQSESINAQISKWTEPLEKCKAPAATKQLSWHPGHGLSVPGHSGDVWTLPLPIRRLVLKHLPNLVQAAIGEMEQELER